jgi:FkbM family methyltransferase
LFEVEVLMGAMSRLRHSILGKAVRMAIHILYHARYRGNRPVFYHLAEGCDLSLYPEGEIAEFLAFPWLFEKTEVGLVAAFLKPGMRVIDVGANIGLYSILARKAVGETGAVWAFEPSAESAGRLRRNLALNGCDDVSVFPIGLGAEAGATMYLGSDAGYGDAYRYVRPAPGPTSSGSSASREVAEPAASTGRDEVVTITSLDRWAEENGVDRADFLKVDIEGAEYWMLLGARKFLAECEKIVIMVECEQDWCERAGCRQEDTFDVLRSLGFGLYAWKGRQRKWATDDQSLRDAGMIWACKDPHVLPAA